MEERDEEKKEENLEDNKQEKGEEKMKEKEEEKLEEKKEEKDEEKVKEKEEEKLDKKKEDKKEEKNGEKKAKKEKEKNENIQRDENSTFSIKKENNIEDEDEYLFYCVIEVFEYQTSQRDITLGLRNPKDEYQRICMDFNIKYDEETSYLDYDEANKYQLSTFMLWGSKESLFSFLKFHKIKIAIDSLENKNNEKSGIYLCINKATKIAYLIIWPGKKSYEYSKIDEPNDSILLTLIRYGFYLSRNSILCLSNNEIEEFNYNGYEIFQDPESSAFLTERNQVLVNENINKIFKIEETNHFIEGLKDILKEKKIVDAKINQNCILLSEELKDAIKTSKIEKKKFDEFILYESKFDIYFEENFGIKNIPINKFYLLIRQCPCYLKNKKNSNCYSEEQLKDIFAEKLNKEIDKLFNQINSELLDDNYFNRKYICQYCKDNKNTNELYYNKERKYFHKSCYLGNQKNKAQFNFKELDEDAKEIEKYQLYLSCKNNILKKIGNKKNKKNELIINLFINSEKKFEIIENKNALMIDKNILFEEIQNFKDLIYDYNYNNKEGNKLIEKEYMQYLKLLSDKDKNAKCEEWKKYWKEKINKYFNENKNKIEKWVILKSYTKNNKNKTEFNYFLDYEYKEKYYQTTIINLYEIMPYKDTSNLNLRFSEYLGKENEIENYFYQENLDGIVIYKKEDQIMIKLNDVREISFKGIYDYDYNSKILILFREEDGIKKTVLFLNNQITEPNFKIYKNLEINELLTEDSKVYNIKLIPCINGYENQSVLFFIDNKIKLMKIKDGTQTGKFLDLSKFFNYNDFSEFQFIIYFDFILILKYDEKSKEWKGKVFSLYLKDNSLFEEINNIKLKGKRIDKNIKFSFAEIKKKKYLLGQNIINNNLFIFYWEITSQISGIITDYETIGTNNNEIEEKIPLGNCIINYFYYCFEKYPLIGAIQYNFRKFGINKGINLGFFVEDQDYENISDLKTYIDELRIICERKKSISFNDMDFQCIDDYKSNCIIKDSSIGKLIIGFLEIIPIQVAKIMKNEFSIMSDGETMQKRLSIETNKRKNLKKGTKFNLIEYSNMINFCFKESILNYFELPVVVVCCFGTQSIGKSTFLNELTGSFFDVSGMRCTEGIWMSIKLFVNSIEKEKNECKRKCENCHKNKCYLWKHNKDKKKKKEKKCLCEDCICGKECLLYNENINNKNVMNCDIKCCLPKGHEDFIKCSLCDCKCICKCTCKGKAHKHLCNLCNKTNNKCFCECNCKHFCKYPILLHNFICICLDFEGLGTFERSNEQDIQMALIGSAMGNIVIFRTHNSLDRFTEDTLEKLSQGSRKIKSLSADDYFGGSLCFCPRDVIHKDKDKLRNEFNQKMEDFVKGWLEQTKETLIQNDKENKSMNTLGKNEILNEELKSENINTNNNPNNTNTDNLSSKQTINDKEKITPVKKKKIIPFLVCLMIIFLLLLLLI